MGSPAVPPRTRLGEDVLTTGQIARMFGTAPRTVAKWIDAGHLPGVRVPGSPDRRVYRDVLIRFAADHGLRLPEWFARPAEPVAVGLPPGWAGLESLSPLQTGARAARGELAAVAVGCRDGFAEAVRVGRDLRGLGAALRLALVVGADRDPAAVPPGVFDRVYAADAQPPADVAAYLREPVLARAPGRAAAAPATHTGGAN